MKKLIISLIGLIITLILIFVFVIPLWDSLGSSKDNFSFKETELKWIEERMEKVNHLKAEYRNLESEIQKVFLALPDEEDIPNLLVQFEALASNSGLVLDNISFGQLAQKDSKPTGRSTGAEGSFDTGSSSGTTSALRSLDVTMKLAGRYTNFKNYLNSLGRNIRSMSVESISFGSSNGSAINTFTFDLTVNVYYQ